MVLATLAAYCGPLSEKITFGGPNEPHMARRLMIVPAFSAVRPFSRIENAEMPRQSTRRQQHTIYFSLHFVHDHPQLEDVGGYGFKRPVGHGLWSHLTLSLLVGPRRRLTLLAVLNHRCRQLLSAADDSPASEFLRKSACLDMTTRLVYHH